VTGWFRRVIAWFSLWLGPILEKRKQKLDDVRYEEAQKVLLSLFEGHVQLHNGRWLEPGFNRIYTLPGVYGSCGYELGLSRALAYVSHSYDLTGDEVVERYDIIVVPTEDEFGSDGEIWLRRRRRFRT
jgi:hypothetical protein